MILPDLIVWRELDWEIRNHEVSWTSAPSPTTCSSPGRLQPYITLSKGNATAEESILLNYVGPPVFCQVTHFNW